MIKKQRSLALLMFTIGLFSQTQIRVIGSIGISELVMFLVAPFIYLRHQQEFRRAKMFTVSVLLFLVMIGCVISCVENNTVFAAAARGFASPYGLWACLIVFYHLLRKSPMDFKWYLLGSACSFVLCTFIFQQAVEAYVASGSGLGVVSADEIISGPIYWIGRLSGFVMWPIQGAYLQCPLFYSVVGSFLFGAWAMLTSASGRSAALIGVMSSVLIFIGGKNPKKMMRLRKWFVPMLVGGACFVVLFKNVYTYAAAQGHLGEHAQKKLEDQTKGKTDLLHVVMGGRLPVFIGAYACMQKPLVGYGPWALDHDRIAEDFMAKYGNAEDYEKMMKTRADDLRLYGIMRGPGLLPAHSAIIGWWLWYGIFGLIFWFYILYLLVDFMRKRIGTVPEFFGYFACTILSTLWSLFFSPFGGRMPWAFLLAMFFLNREMDWDMRRSGAGWRLKG